MKDTERHHYIGEHICALRESKGWTQQTLGKKAGEEDLNYQRLRNQCQAAFCRLLD